MKTSWSQSDSRSINHECKEFLSIVPQVDINISGE